MDEFAKEFYNEGELAGKAQGKLEAIFSIATEMKKSHTISDEDIAKFTKLSLEQVKAIVA